MKTPPRAPALPLMHLTLLVLLLASCSTGSDAVGPVGSSTITLDLVGLEPVAGGLNYQAWAVASDGGNSYYGYPLVLFNVDENGSMVDASTGEPLGDAFHADLDPEQVLGIGISLEVSTVLVSNPSHTFILGGEISGGQAALTTDDWLGLSADFSAAAGSYIVATLTDQAAPSDFHGVWFAVPEGDGFAPDLVLPQAPTGWDYEGWVEVSGTPLSTGKFYAVDQADGSSLYSGATSPPPFPGEDFLVNAPEGVTFPPNLAEATVFVTLEPWGEWDTAPEVPFYLRILEAHIPDLATSRTPYALTSLFGEFPSGTATVQ